MDIPRHVHTYVHRCMCTPDTHRGVPKQAGYRMGNTRDLFKKIGDTKGPFHAKTGTIKHRNGRNLMKQKRLRRGGKNTQELYRKMTWITMMVCVVTQQEPDSLECEVKWALGKHLY